MNAYASTLPELPVYIYHTYSPEGFDSNDDIEIFISGALPNTCYKSPKVEITRQGNVFFAEVTAFYTGGQGEKCAEMLIPFLQKVNLGVLDKGNYQVKAKSGLQVIENSTVKIYESTSNSVDDNVYADVEYIKENSFNRVVELIGYNPSDCFELDEVKLVHNNKDTYSILPIMKKVYELCPMKMVPFSYEVEIPVVLDKSVVLLHVRSMEGRSVNRLFSKHR